MPIQIKCRECKKTLRVAEKYAGKRAKCPACKTPFKVPEIAPPSRPDDTEEAALPGRRTGKKTPAAQPARKPAERPARKPVAAKAAAPEESQEKPSKSKGLWIAIGGTIAVVLVAGLCFWLFGGESETPPKIASDSRAVQPGKSGDSAPDIAQPVADTPPAQPVEPEPEPTPADIARAKLARVGKVLKGLGNSANSKLTDWTREWQFGKATGLSWRVHALRYAKDKELFALWERFKQGEPWDSEHNIKLLDEIPDIYRFSDEDGTNTRFQILKGEGLVCDDGRATPFRSFYNLKESTILMAIVGADKAVPWTKPEDLRFDPEDPIGALGELFENRIELCMCDGELLSLPANCDPGVFAALATASTDDLFVDAPGMRFGYGIVPGKRIEVAPMSADSLGRLRLKKLDRIASSVDRHNLNKRTWIPETGLSWKVHALPAFGYRQLYEAFNLDEPWDSSHNKELLPLMPDIYRFHPDHEHVTALRRGQIWVEQLASESLKGKINYGEVHDGARHTILFTLAGKDKAIPWTQPEPATTGDPAEVGNFKDAYAVIHPYRGLRGLILPLVAATPDEYRALQSPAGKECICPLSVKRRSEQQLGLPPMDEHESLRRSLVQFSLGTSRYGNGSSLPVQDNSESVGPDGKPGLSWRVHILEGMGYEQLAAAFKLDEPWDSPHNIKLLDRMPDVFRAAGDPADSTTTRFVRLTGPGTLFDTPFGPNSREHRNLRGSLRLAVQVIAAGPEKAVPWTKPVDIVFDGQDPYGCIGKSTIDGGYLALFGIMTRKLPLNLTNEQFADLVQLKRYSKSAWREMTKLAPRVKTPK